MEKRRHNDVDCVFGQSLGMLAHVLGDGCPRLVNELRHRA
jgi:hypothetical protein